MFALIAYFAIFGCLAFGQTDNNSSLYGDQSQNANSTIESTTPAKPLGPPKIDEELPVARTKRQSPTFTCVPIGTCGQTNPGSGTIDPRIITPINPGWGTINARNPGWGGINGYIVSPSQGITQPPVQGVCPLGQEACYGSTPTAQCGRRLVNSISDIDGPATLGAFPWQAYLRNQNGYTGSGVLVDSWHVLTAAHKVNLNVASPGSLIVNMGVYDPTSLATSQQRTVASMVIHERFDATTLKNDIAVLRLSSPITLGSQVNVGTACLPAASSSYIGQRCVVSGWGKSSFSANDAPTSTQKQVRLPIVDYNTCRNSMAQASVLGNLTNADRYLDPNGEICAGGEANRDTCTSDGGSPLVCLDGTGRWNVAGLVIWGKNCGLANVYGVYVDVPKYRSWIDGAIARLNAG